METQLAKLKEYWFIIAFIGGLIFNYATALNNQVNTEVRMTKIEARLDKKDDQYLTIQTQLAQIITDVATSKANTSIILKKLDLK